METIFFVSKRILYGFILTHILKSSLLVNLSNKPCENISKGNTFSTRCENVSNSPLRIYLKHTIVKIFLLASCLTHTVIKSLMLFYLLHNLRMLVLYHEYRIRQTNKQTKMIHLICTENTVVQWTRCRQGH